MFYRFDYSNASLLQLVHTWVKLRQQQLTQKENVDKLDSISEELREEVIKLPSSSALMKYVQLCVDYDLITEGDAQLPAPLNRYDPLISTCTFYLQN